MRCGLTSLLKPGLEAFRNATLPTHVRFFGLYSFYYFAETADQPRRKVPNFYTPLRFRVESIRFQLLKQSIPEKILRAVLQPLINKSVERLLRR